MKFLCRISLYFIVGVISFGLGIYTHEKVDNANNHIYNENKKNTLQDLQIDTKEEEIETEVSTFEKPTLSVNTKYIVEEYYPKEERTEQIEDLLPPQYAGRNRDELLEIIQNYEKAPSLSDKEKGMTSIELLSFSEERVVIRKVYETAHYEEFYLVMEADVIVVYDGELDTIFMKTDIKVDDLPESVRNEILERKYIKNEEELYNFLESYTS